jgi:hypothetical protein
MAQFLGTLQGDSKEIHRLGSKESGIRVHAKGWRKGVRVIGYHEDGKDKFDVYVTGGSGGMGKEVLIATVVEDELTKAGE